MYQLFNIKHIKIYKESFVENKSGIADKIIFHIIVFLCKILSNNYIKHKCAYNLSGVQLLK